MLASLLDTAKNPGRAFDTGGAVSCRSGPNWLSCDNPSPVPPVREDPRFRIAGFRVQWDDEAVTLACRMGRVNASTSAPHGFDGLSLGAYIDFNQVARAGSMKLIEGAFSDSINPEDAWEAAVTVTGWGFGLYRTNPRGDPVLEFRGAPAADPASGDIIVRLPRVRLRGNPARWGWVVTAGEPGPGGTVLRGILGDRMLQRRLAGRTGPDAKAAQGRVQPSLNLKAVRTARNASEH
ncbi:MAG: hypothetical protein HZB91_06810 [Elusimicrobia bacterium]|nr:hypothetical protein [Elusimicrobiota bacterium]